MRAEGHSTEAILVIWGRSPGALFYTVYRSASASGPFIPIAGVAAGFNQSFFNTGLAPSTTYYYVVTASDASGESPRSSPPAAATTLLAAPTGVQAYSTDVDTIYVEWQPAGNAITSYTISRSPTASGIFAQIGTVNVAPNTSTMYRDAGLLSGTKYFYQVSAASGSNRSPPSTPPTSATTRVSAPTGLAAQATSATSITVTWNPSVGAEYYAIFGGTSSTGLFYPVGTSISPSFTEAGLAPGTTRCYRVMAGVGGAVFDTPVAPVCATTPSVSAPSVVVAQAKSPSVIEVTWSASPGATRYTVYQSTSATRPFSQWTQVGMPVAALRIDATGLNARTTYYYVVTASSAGQTSAPSAPPASTTTLLAAPTNVAASATSPTTIAISWTPSAGATSFAIWRATSMSGPFTTIGSSTGSPFNDSGGTPGARFFYVVSASDNTGNTSPNSSPPASASLAPAAPANLHVNVATGAMTAKIEWDASAGAQMYNVFSSGDGTGWKPLGTQTSRSFAITANLWYTVSASNAGGESPKAMPAAIWLVSVGP